MKSPLKELIDAQIETNRGINLFSEDSLNLFRFSDSILGSLDKILKANDEELTNLVEHAKKKTLDEFCRVNQYYTIDTELQRNLETIYLLLFDEIRTWKRRQVGDYVRYAQTYLKILGALKIGGRFHYTPGLEFIEQHLDCRQYTVQRKRLDNGFDSVIIERTK